MCHKTILDTCALVQVPIEEYSITNPVCETASSDEKIRFSLFELDVILWGRTNPQTEVSF